MAKLSGKGGSFSIGGSTFHISEFEFNEEVNVPDVTDSGTTSPYTEHVAGRIRASFSGRGWVDAAALPHATIWPGTTISTVLLKIDGAGNEVTIPTAIIRSLSFGVPIGSGEAVSFQFSAVVSGSYTKLG